MGTPGRADGPLAQKSRKYGIAQTVILCAFAGVFMADPSRRPGYAEYKTGTWGVVPFIG